ncbi:MAG: retention module-containing protein, partial [Rhodocyclaceae bacterium]|nr:retention module-containing protein [Rhodocyclaceae bacterium]
MAAAGNVVGKVAVVQGQAFARAKDGTQRPLKVGDVVYENEVIVTAENSRVELEFDSGKLFLLRANETATLDSAVVGSELPESRNAALLDRVGELAEITRAIAEGSSLDQLLEETAAGLTGGGDGSGHSFVQLLRIAELLDPTENNYQFNAGNLGFELPSRGSVPDGVPIPVPAPPAPGGNLSPFAAAVSVLGTEDAASIPVSLSATDADGTIASYTIISLPANGTLFADAAHTIVVSAGDMVVSPTLFFVPNTNWNGTTNFNFTATDNIGAVSSTATVTLNVGSVDDLPVAVNDSPLGVTEDTPFSGTLATNDTPSGDGGNVWSL